MQGTVVSFFEKTKKAGGMYLNVVMQIEGNQTQFLCTDAATIEKVKVSVGQPIDFYTFKSKDGSATFMSLPKGGGSASSSSSASAGGSWKKSDASRNESFACSYAKDIVIALINKDLIKADLVEGSIKDYVNVFLELLNPKSA